MILTEQTLSALRTPRGGFLAETISALGENIAVRGWRLRLIGREIPDATYRNALARVSAGSIRCVPYSHGGREPPGQSLFTLA